MTPQLAALVPVWYRPPFQAADAVAAAAEVFGLCRQDIIGSSREREICRARWAAMLTLRRRGYSLPRIGRAIGDRDHTTVMHGLVRARDLCAAEPEYAQQCLRVATA